MRGQRRPTSHGEVVVVVEVAAEADVTLLPAEEEATEVLPDGAGAVEVGVLIRAGGVELDVVGVVDEVPDVNGEPACEAPVCDGVDVEETNGGAF